MIIHIGLPFATLLSVVLMIKPMATLLDHGIEQMGMPTSFGAILIALLVLSPEGVAAYNAAARNQLQREYFASLLRTHCNAAGNGITSQLILWIFI